MHLNVYVYMFLFKKKQTLICKIISDYSIAYRFFFTIVFLFSNLYLSLSSLPGYAQIDNV